MLDFIFGEKREETKVIDDFVSGQLVPSINKMEELAVNVARYRQSPLGFLNGRKIHFLQKSFQEQNKNFLVLYRLYGDPDKLFADMKLDPAKDRERIGAAMDAYYSSKKIIDQLFLQGFKILEITDRQLSWHYQMASHRMLIALSIFAICISAFAIMSGL